MSSRNLGSLTIDLLLKLGGFKQGANQAQREVDNLSRNINSKVKGISNTFSGLGKAFAAVGVGFSVAGIISGLTSAASKAIEFGDEMEKASAKTGVTVESFSELAYAAKQTDVPLEALSTSFKKMQVAISQAGSGSKQALATFQALGVNFDELRALSPDKQFELLADRIHALKDPADRARAAVELFGKAGADLLPLFEQGAAGIALAREEAHRMGATLTGEQAAALAAADDAIKHLHASWDGLSRTWTAIIALPLANFLDGITKVITRQENPVKAAGKAWLDYFLAFSGGPANAARVFLQKLNAPPEIPRPPVTPLLGTGLAPGGHSRVASAPGYVPPPDTSGAKQKVQELEEIVIHATQTAVDATSDLYKQLDERTQTSIERQLDQWKQFDRDVQDLVAAGRIDNVEAQKRIAENADKYLEPLEIHAEKIFPEKEQQKLNTFWDQAARNAQDIFSEFLFDPFKEGIGGLIKSFGDMLRQLAAQAVAAQIASKIFGTGGAGGLLSGIGKFLGFASGGYTGSGGKYEPAGIVHKGEGVLSREDVSALGGPQGFFALLGAIRNGYADGGYVTAGAPSYGMVSSKSDTFGSITRSNDSDRPVVNNFQFDIHAPAGSVSRSTQQQIAAAASRGISVANSRNN